MSHSDDTFWRQMCAAEEPTAAEMARAEAELQQEQGAEPLPAAMIDALVAGAVASQPAVVTLEKPKKKARRLVIAAMALASVAAVTQVLWPERQRSFDTLPYTRAVILASESGYEDSERLSALMVIFTRCQAVAEGLSAVGRDPDPQIAARANEIRAAGIGLLESGVAPTRREIFAPDVLDLLRAAQEPGNATEHRLEALAQLERFLDVSLRAIAASPMITQDGILSRDSVVALLVSFLSN